MTANIQKGDIVTHLNGTVGTAASSPGLSSCRDEIVSVQHSPEEGGFYIPWHTEWIVRIERNGAVVYDANAPVQLSLF